MTREEAKLSIERIHREKQEKDSSDLRALLRILAEELNSKDTHFIWELLQNAEDNEYDGAEPALSLRIETTDPTQTPSADGCLIVLNNETGFEEKHVLGICSAGNGTKKRDDDHDYIGEKGIGFKSVFRVSDRPHIFSNG